MELKDLTGLRFLDGVDFVNEDIPDYPGAIENCQVCRFRLDGTVYVAAEDPEDGYRSSMRDLYVADKDAIKNTFEPIRVMCKHRTEGSFGYADDVLEIIDIKTGRSVLIVGTENTDDYYPSFIANFDPAAMSLNENISDENNRQTGKN
ncbi:MAG: DUF2800 domain-containing protein [Candidatus Thiodiazotropha lotti]|nr:DUF2800 domain-containing protein [Candidatus Thiodiazotropha lotti]